MLFYVYELLKEVFIYCCVDDILVVIVYFVD